MVIKKSYFFLILSLIIFFYIFYKSEIFWDSKRRDYYEIYYFISFIFVIFSILFIFISNYWKKIITISVFSIAFSFYIFEIYLFYLLKPNNLEKKVELYKNINNKNYDERSLFKIWKDLKDEGYVVSVGAYTHENLQSLSGISNSKTIMCNENGYYAIYDSDRYGFNNPDSEWDNEEIKFLLVGDSFTHGACVNRPNDIASRLRTLSNSSVLNLGYGSNGPLLEFATLREYLPNKTNYVLWLYFEGNDILGLDYELKNPFLINYLKDEKFSQNLKNKQDLIDKLAREITIEESQKSKFGIIFKEFSRLIKLSNTRETFFPKSMPVKEFEKVLDSANNLVKQNNSELYFVYLPSFERYKVKGFDNNVYNKVLKIVEKLDIKIIDINKEVFEKEKNPLSLFPFEMMGHYNELGYKKISNVIFSYFKNK